MRYTLAARVKHGDLNPIGRFMHNESIDGYGGGFSYPIDGNIQEQVMQRIEKQQLWSKADILRVREIHRIYRGSHFPKNWHDRKLSPEEHVLMEAARVKMAGFWALQGGAI